MRARIGGLLLAVAMAAVAQDEAPVATEMRPDAETTAAAAPPPGPRPAMIAPLASRSTLLGLDRAGARLVAVGQRGHILLSEDARVWRQVPVPVDAMLNRVRFRDERRGWAVGHDATILATSDGGESWTLQHHDPAGRPLYDVLFLAGESIVAMGGYGSYLVSADGKSWAPHSFPVSELGQHFNAATRLGDGTLLIAGERGLLARSRDGGESWDLLDSPYTGSFFGVLPQGDKGALVFGLRGNIYVTDDVSTRPTIDVETYDPFTREAVAGGAALAKLGWRRIEAPTTEGLFGGAADGGGALLVGVNGVRLRVSPGADRAELLQGPALETLNDVLRHGERWLAVGRRGVQDLGALP